MFFANMLCHSIQYLGTYLSLINKIKMWLGTATTMSLLFWEEKFWIPRTGNVSIFLWPTPRWLISRCLRAKRNHCQNVFSFNKDFYLTRLTLAGNVNSGYDIHGRVTNKVTFIYLYYVGIIKLYLHNIPIGMQVKSLYI